MVLGPMPRVAAHAFRHPLSARETYDSGPLTDRAKRPPVPVTKRPPKQKPTCGAILREEKKFGNQPSCLSTASSRTRSTDGRLNGNNVMQQYFGRKNAYDRELTDPGNQVFEWGPQRKEIQKDANHAKCSIIDRERLIGGTHAPWAGPQEIAAKLEPVGQKFHGRANTILNEMRASEQAKQDDEGPNLISKAPGRVNCLSNELKGPTQLASDPVDSFARLGLY